MPDFKAVTDELGRGIEHRDLAREIARVRKEEDDDAERRITQQIRQARLPAENKSKRPPPEGWETAAARVARKRARRLLDLAEQLSPRRGGKEEEE